MHNQAVYLIAFGLTAAACFGTADFFAASASKKVSAALTAVWVSVISAVIFSVYFAIDQGSTAWSTSGLLYTLAGSAFVSTGLLAFYYALEAGPVSIVSPIGGAYPLITALISVVFLHAVLSGLNVAGISMVVVGIILASGVLEAKKTERHFNKGVAASLLAFVLWGIGFAFAGKAVQILGWQKETFVDLWFGLLVIAMLVLATNGTAMLNKGSAKLVKNKFIVATAVVQLVGLVAFNIGLTKVSSVAVITAVAASYPALTVFLALKQLNEKQALVPLTGSFITVAGIVVLSV